MIVLIGTVYNNVYIHVVELILEIFLHLKKSLEPCDEHISLNMSAKGFEEYGN